MDAKRRDDAAPGLFVPNGWHGGFMNCVRKVPLEVFNQVGLRAMQVAAITTNHQLKSRVQQHKCSYSWLCMRRAQKPSEMAALITSRCMAPLMYCNLYWRHVLQAALQLVLQPVLQLCLLLYCLRYQTSISPVQHNGSA